MSKAGKAQKRRTEPQDHCGSFIGPVLNFSWRLHLLWGYGHSLALPHNLCLSSGLCIYCNCSNPSSSGKNFKILLLESENELPRVRSEAMRHDHIRLRKRISGIVFHPSVVRETELFGTWSRSQRPISSLHPPPSVRDSEPPAMLAHWFWLLDSQSNYINLIPEKYPGPMTHREYLTSYCCSADHTEEKAPGTGHSVKLRD